MAIDRKSIIDNLSKIRIVGNDEGLIPMSGVFITQLPTRFWNSFAERLTRKVPEDLLSSAEWLLINAAQECGYHTGHSIISSEEWKAVVEPMIETKEDVLHGAFAVFTAWGWGKAKAVEIIPNERMVVHAYEYYESDIISYGVSDKHSSYMVAGVCAAFMDLVYGGEYDSTGETGLKTFSCKQTKGIETGDEYAEFVVERT